MEEAHRRHGRLPWADLFAPAIRLAEGGFRVSQRLAELIAGEGERLKHDPVTAAYFFNADGKALAAGSLLRNQAYADTLRRIAAEGADAFYGGEIAADIVAKVRNDPTNPGLLDLGDLEHYAVMPRPPVCGPFAGAEVCSMGPPSSGGIGVLQILSLVEPYGLDRLGPQSIEAWRLIGDASRLAFADRERWLSDPDKANIPVRGLLAPGYLALRAKLLSGPKALDKVTPGTPAFDNGALVPTPGAGHTPELPSTTQVVIRDREGDVISYTGTIENAFGARLMVRGFLLNNELTDFSFTATDDQGRAVANRVEGGKRPRSSMAPTIVLRNDQPILALGSPGGSRIIGFVAQSLIAHLAWDLDVQQAVSMPHMLNRFGPYELEAGTPAERFGPGLAEIGYKVQIQDLNSGLAALAITPGGLQGAADPRREGVAIGE
ncbi:gamma-glutamyltransferase family protein [Oleomonas cavernae]|uniref:gamma-glutamyltransferase family protein n=1 Tax=Oleomonas cavernae TaxID=2320859 RepID=UPI0023685A15|nr:gamma-glutamyltransferase family protein [Oleomonas cavernae]